ncbi:hypothetical protein LINPERPRIM_LOCUS5717 [Linum perenne]
MVWHGKIASIDNLQKRGMIMTNWCALCQKDAESVDHLFSQCHFASEVWDRVSSKLSLFGPRNGNVKGLFSAWKGMNCTPSFPESSRVVIHGVVWYIWLERNERVFKDVRRSEFQVSQRVLCNIGRWLGAARVFSEPRLSRWYEFIFDPG